MSIYANIRARSNKTKMTQQKSKKSLVSRLKVAPVLLVAILLVGGGSVGVVHASIQSQIAEQQAQKAQNQSQLSGLVAKATSYQDAINKLQAQIGDIENAIANNQAKQAEIEHKIVVAQHKLDEQKSFLRSDIKSMYVSGQMSTVEMLATSKNLSDFVDAETYRGAVQTKIQDTLDQIAQLQNSLHDQKNQVQSLVNAEKSQRNQLADTRSQQSQLLNLNQGQQASYTQKIKENNKKIAALQAEQARLNAMLTSGTHGGGSGGYPWSNVPCPYAGAGPSCYSYNWGYSPSQQLDTRGWGYRNCTSYVFWRLSTLGYNLDWSMFPNVYQSDTRYGDPQGAIKESWRDFRNMGYTDSNQNLNSGIVVAVRTQGTYGHIMFVNGANGDSVSVSQYNGNEDGTYSTGTISRYEAGIHFIHITN